MKTLNSKTPQGFVKRLNTSMRSARSYLNTAAGGRHQVSSARSVKGVVYVRLVTTGSWVAVSSVDRIEIAS